MMTYLIAIVFLVGLTITDIVALSDSCMNLNGSWYNDQDIEMNLTHTVDGVLTGNYSRDHTASMSGGSAAESGHIHHLIVGAAPYGSQFPVLGFSILLHGDSSVQAWTGQCLVYEHEVLETSWLQHRQTDTCVTEGHSTLIGQMRFSRHRPKDARSSRSVCQAESTSYIAKEKRERRDTGQTYKPCNLLGCWDNELGSEMDIKTIENDTIRGEYLTKVPVHIIGKIYGRSNFNDPHCVFAFHVIWSNTTFNGTSITTWVGQCDNDNVEVLLTDWLLRRRVKNDDNWASIQYGKSTFTKRKQPGPCSGSGTQTTGPAAGASSGVISGDVEHNDVSGAPV